MIDTGAAERHRKRADEMGDSMRRYLIGVNAGGIGVLATLADKASGGTADIIVPLGSFTLGLLFTGISIWLQKVKAIRRRDAAEKGDPEPIFDSYLKSNETYDGMAFGLFIAGALTFFVI